jgi:hypothetical protein
MASSKLKRISENERFLRAIVKARNNPPLLKRIIKAAGPQHLHSLAEIVKNLKHIPLTEKEKVEYCKRRQALKTFIRKKSTCAVRKSICLKRNVQKGKGKNQTGGLFPLLPTIASIGVNLLSSLFGKKAEQQ